MIGQYYKSITPSVSEAKLCAGSSLARSLKIAPRLISDSILTMLAEPAIHYESCHAPVHLPARSTRLAISTAAEVGRRKPGQKEAHLYPK